MGTGVQELCGEEGGGHFRRGEGCGGRWARAQGLGGAAPLAPREDGVCRPLGTGFAETPLCARWLRRRSGTAERLGRSFPDVLRSWPPDLPHGTGPGPSRRRTRFVSVTAGFDLDTWVSAVDVSPLDCRPMSSSVDRPSAGLPASALPTHRPPAPRSHYRPGTGNTHGFSRSPSSGGACRPPS